VDDGLLFESVKGSAFAKTVLARLKNGQVSEATVALKWIENSAAQGAPPRLELTRLVSWDFLGPWSSPEQLPAEGVRALLLRQR